MTATDSNPATPSRSAELTVQPGSQEGVSSVCVCMMQIGHAGTLDPMATGLLIICTGKGTKSIDTFQAMHKEYSGQHKHQSLLDFDPPKASAFTLDMSVEA